MYIYGGFLRFLISGDIIKGNIEVFEMYWFCDVCCKNKIVSRVCVFFIVLLVNNFYNVKLIFF